MSYYFDTGGKCKLLDINECAHLAHGYICTCETSKYCMDVPPDGYCYKEGGCIYFEDEAISDEFCKNQEKDTEGKP